MSATRLRILVVLHDFALGGTERVALRLAAAWAEAGCSVTVFTGSQSGPLRPLAGDRAALESADPPIARGPGSRRRLAAAARRFADSHRFDIAFIPGNYHWPVAEALAGRGLRIVAQISAALDKPQRKRLRQWAFEVRMRHLLRGVDALVALSDPARDQANRILRRPAATTIATPALADDLVPPVPVPETRPPVVVAAGRLVPEKGFAGLIRAFAALPRLTARLVIVGDGPERDRLTALARTLGVADEVCFAGYVDDIRPWLDAARLFVLSSDFEGFPAVLVEALAAGRPVVATECTPATRLLDLAGAGAVVPIGDPAALSQAIARMLAQAPPDPQRLSAIVGRHRIGIVARAYLDLFESLSA